MDKFNKVVLRNKTEQMCNVHIAAHPFRCEYSIKAMNYKGDYRFFLSEETMPEWQQKLADQLWDGIPGLHTLFFTNGNITIQHSGVFDDDDIFEAACEIIRPVLETNKLLNDLE